MEWNFQSQWSENEVKNSNNQLSLQTMLYLWQTDVYIKKNNSKYFVVWKIVGKNETERKREHLR